MVGSVGVAVHLAAGKDRHFLAKTYKRKAENEHGIVFWLLAVYPAGL